MDYSLDAPPRPHFVKARVVSKGDPFGYQASKNLDRVKRLTIHALADFFDCPAKSRYPAPQRDPTDDMQLGSLVDCMALTPDQLDRGFIAHPLTYPSAKEGPKPWNWNANHCKDWRAQQPAGAVILSAEDMLRATIAVQRLHNEFDEILLEADKQVWVEAEYVDEATKITVPVCGLIDIVPHVEHPQYGKALMDLKTCNSAYPFAWTKHVHAYKYHWQAAFYSDIYVAATNEDRCDWAHIVQENKPPYEVARRWLSSEFIQLGRDEYWYALKRYCECVLTNTWPSYDDPGWDPRATFINDNWRLVQPEAWMLKV